MNQLKEITDCEVCDSKVLQPVLNLGTHPLCDDLIAIGDERRCQEYPIEIVLCPNCITAHQRFQVPKQDLFPTSYHYRSRFTDDVLKGMSALVDSCEQRVGSLVGKKILDIGCNDGSLLNFFKQKNAITIGIEPTNAIADADSAKHFLYCEFLSPSTAEKIVAVHGQPDIITFTNVFAHIEDLSSVLSSLKILISPTTLIVIENHYLGSVLERNQFDTFYHEHPRTYSATSFFEIAKKLGMSIQDLEFTTRYGGNIRVFLSKQNTEFSSTDLNHALEQERQYINKFTELQTGIKNWQRKKAIILNKLRQGGYKIPAKAFPGRAAILIKMLGVDEQIISAVHEKPGSMKIGHYVPGTRIPIHSDDDLFLGEDQSKQILNLAWHISAEIKSYLHQNGYNGEVLDILTLNDFNND